MSRNPASAETGRVPVVLERPKVEAHGDLERRLPAEPAQGGLAAVEHEELAFGRALQQHVAEVVDPQRRQPRPADECRGPCRRR